jgi:DNA repair exonuclease SbcCD nuclease subunit
MRILHLSDTHLGAATAFVGAPPGWSRAHDHAAAFEAALGPAYREEVDVVLHTGDLFDRSRPPEAAMTLALQHFTTLARRVPVVVMPGNHDRQGLRAHLSCPPPGLFVIDTATHMRLPGLRLGVVPFERVPARWAQQARIAVDEGVDLLLCHQSFDGSRVPGHVFRPMEGADTLGAADLPPNAPLVLTGHIHSRQDLRLAGRRILHVGSTERTSFVERGEAKGSMVLDLSTQSFRWCDTQPRAMRYIRSPEDLAGVRPHSLVALARTARSEEIEAAALARGAYVQRWSRADKQLSLFTEP